MKKDYYLVMRNGTVVTDHFVTAQNKKKAIKKALKYWNQNTYDNWYVYKVNGKVQ